MSRRGSSPVLLDARPHGVVLARPLVKALALTAAGAALLAVGWPATPVGALSLALAAAIALRAVWTWERTRLVITDDEIGVVTGTLRRRAARLPLGRVGAIEVEQGPLGRLLGYGTLVAGELEIPHVAHPADVARLVR